MADIVINQTPKFVFVIKVDATKVIAKSAIVRVAVVTRLDAKTRNAMAVIVKEIAISWNVLNVPCVSMVFASQQMKTSHVMAVSFIRTLHAKPVNAKEHRSLVQVSNVTFARFVTLTEFAFQTKKPMELIAHLESTEQRPNATTTVRVSFFHN
jgi:hypothetical protein